MDRLPPLTPSQTDPVTPDPAAATRRSDRYFDTSDLQSGIGRRTARGGAYTMGSTALNFVIFTVSTILITRNLSQADFGLFGMITVLTGFAGMFVDLGLSRAVVQKPSITREQVSTLFWINMGLSVLIAGLVAAATPLVVWFYNEPRLVPINLALPVLFIIGALGRQHRALLQRRMEFGAINIIAVVAPTLAAIVAVILAQLGAGYWALVSMPATNQLVTTLGSWAACRWVPGPPRRKSGVRTMLAYGGNLTGFQFINYFARNADNAMLGFAWGAAPLGLYTRAYSLMMIPATRFNAPLTSIAVPALSRLADQPERYRKAYRRMLLLIASATVPPLCLLLITSPEIVPLVLGAQWADAVPYFLALGPAGILGCTNVASGWIYQSIGHVDRQLRWAVIVVPIIVIAMAVGLQFGPLGVAIGLSSVMVVTKLPELAFACWGQSIPVGVRDYLQAMAFPTLTGMLAGASAWGLALELSLSPVLTLTVKVMVYLGIYLGLLMTTPLGRQQRQELKSAVSTLRNPGSAKKNNGDEPQPAAASSS